MMNEASTETPDAGDRKRRRVALACTACRTRKSRCNGARPNCSSCAQLGFDCVYMQPTSSTNAIVGKEYLHDLEDRLRTVEDMLGTLLEGTPDTSAESPRIGTPFQGRRTQRLRRQESVGSRTEEQADAEQAVVFATEGEDGYFGPSSNIAFTRQISRAAANLSRAYPSAIEGAEKMQHRAVVATSPPAQSRQSPVDMYDLPPAETTRRLIDRYFRYTGLVYPYIHQESFMEMFAEVQRSNFAKVRRTWLGMLNIVLALAARIPLSDDIGVSVQEREDDAGEVFYQRALRVCDTDILRGTSLELVQYLLLMGQYLQGTQKSIKTWNIHGLAVKAALQLGLHSSEASRTYPPIEREVRKRTWYACVVLDRNLSMTFGRPCAIPDNYIKLDPVQPYQTSLSSSGFDTGSNQGSVDFFNATIKLCRIMWNTVDRLYGSNLGCPDSTTLFESASRVLQIDQELLAWECDLPASMTMIPSSEAVSAPLESGDGFWLRRFQVILTLRRHNLHILIHRPILVQFLLQESPNVASEQEIKEYQFLERTAPTSMGKAVRSALDTISIIHAHLMSDIVDQQTLLGAWWYSLYYTFNAALIIAASLLIQRRSFTRMQRGVIASGIDAGTMRMSLDNAIEAFERLRAGSKVAAKCGEFVLQLVKTVDAFDMAASNQPWTQSHVFGTMVPAWSASSGTMPFGNDPTTATSPFRPGPENYGEFDFDWESFMAETGQEFFAGL